jgi:hypothetical protein
VPALRREGVTGPALRHEGVTEPARRREGVPAGYLIGMRAMFVAYLVLIVAGLAYFTVIGLTHH